MAKEISEEEYKAYLAWKEANPNAMSPEVKERLIQHFKTLADRNIENEGDDTVEGKYNIDRGGVEGEVGPYYIPKESGATSLEVNRRLPFVDIEGVGNVGVPKATTNLQETGIDKLISPTAKGVRASLNALAKMLGFNLMGKTGPKAWEKETKKEMREDYNLGAHRPIPGTK